MSGLVLCGLGVDPARDATLEATAALRACGEVYAAESLDARAVAWLRSVGARARPAPEAKALVARAKAAKGAVGLAVWGHAGYTSALACEVRALAAREGVACRVVASVSPLARHVSDGKVFVGGMVRGRNIGVMGLQSLTAERLAAGAAFQTRFPLVIYDEQGLAARAQAVCAVLRRRYGPERAVEVYLRDGSRRAARLEALESELKDAVALAVPWEKHAP